MPPPSVLIFRRRHYRLQRKDHCQGMAVPTALTSRDCSRSPPRSYNSQSGRSLSVCLLNAQTQLGILSRHPQPGEMPALRPIIQPCIGVMTNIAKRIKRILPPSKRNAREKLSCSKRRRRTYLRRRRSCRLQKAGVKPPLPVISSFGLARKMTSHSHYTKVAHESERTHITYAYLHTRKRLYPLYRQGFRANAIHCSRLPYLRRCRRHCAAYGPLRAGCDALGGETRRPRLHSHQRQL